MLPMMRFAALSHQPQISATCALSVLQSANCTAWRKAICSVFRLTWPAAKPGFQQASGF